MAVAQAQLADSVVPERVAAAGGLGHQGVSAVAGEIEAFERIHLAGDAKHGCPGGWRMVRA